MTVIVVWVDFALLEIGQELVHLMLGRRIVVPITVAFAKTGSGRVEVMGPLSVEVLGYIARLGSEWLGIGAGRGRGGGEGRTCVLPQATRRMVRPPRAPRRVLTKAESTARAGGLLCVLWTWWALRLQTSGSQAWAEELDAVPGGLRRGFYFFVVWT